MREFGKNTEEKVVGVICGKLDNDIYTIHVGPTGSETKVFCNGKLCRHIRSITIHLDTDKVTTMTLESYVFAKDDC